MLAQGAGTQIPAICQRAQNEPVAPVDVYKRQAEDTNESLQVAFKVTNEATGERCV